MADENKVTSQRKPTGQQHNRESVHKREREPRKPNAEVPKLYNGGPHRATSARGRQFNE